MGAYEEQADIIVTMFVRDLRFGVVSITYLVPYYDPMYYSRVLVNFISFGPLVLVPYE